MHPRRQKKIPVKLSSKEQLVPLRRRKSIGRRNEEDKLKQDAAKKSYQNRQNGRATKPSTDSQSLFQAEKVGKAPAALHSRSPKTKAGSHQRNTRN